MPREPDFWYREPGALARVLAPFGSVYGAIAARRLARARPYVSRLPVICVGNFTAGGSGKTPVTMLLAERLKARGERPVGLTRGYGGTERGPHMVDPKRDTADRVGDEPLLLARICPVCVARDRAAGARAIESSGAASVIVMDDGLQNPGLRKDLSIAVVDGVRGLGNGRVIPAGPLRMPLTEQARLVQAILFNGAPSAAVSDELAAHARVPQFVGALEGAAIGHSRYVAFAGIGNPDRFFATARALGASLAAVVPFPDHARFTAGDAARLLALAASSDARLLTTEKDFVRLAGHPELEALAASTDVLPVRMELDGRSEALLAALLDRALAPDPRDR